MQIQLILAHPKPGSFSHAIADRAQATLERLGHEVRRHDLYEEQFDPVIPPQELSGWPTDPRLLPYLPEARDADGFIIVHPNWWGQPPAILKGWVDRVLRPGVGYDFPPECDAAGVPVGLLKARAALVFNTSNTPAEREAAVFGDPLQALWRSCIFHFCGVDNFHRRMFGTMAGSTEADREGWLAEVEALAASQFPPG